MAECIKCGKEFYVNIDWKHKLCSECYDKELQNVVEDLKNKYLNKN